MINKRSLWFMTLFSLAIVLSVYYVTMPSDVFKKTKHTPKVKEENTALVSLRVDSDEQMSVKMEELKNTINNENATSEEKNKAFEEMKILNQNKGKEEEIEKKIKKNQDLDSFVKINENNITVIIDSKKHNKTIANKIMRLVQTCFDTYKNITVKFQ